MPRSRSWPLLAAMGLVVAAAWPASGQTVQEPPVYGEVIDVRTGFVRVTLPKGAPAPRVEDIEVTWKGKAQKVLRVIGGTTGPLELGIAVDRSASMHASFELMRAATLNLVDQGIAAQDRVFAVAFTDETRLLAEGRGEAAKVIAALPSTPELGTRPTALFQALTRTLQLFENADARAALLVVSDGCDTAGGLVSATSVARRASDLAIPVFLLMPDRNACRNTVCQLDASGQWRCTPDSTPGLMHGASNDMFNPAARPTAMSESAEAGGATAERDRFTGLITSQGGGDFVVKDPEDWQRSLGKIFDRLSRQWTIVFEPSSDQVKSDEIKVYSRASGRRKRLE